MVKVLNRAPGPRMFNVKGADDRIEQRVLNPGQSDDLDLAREDDPIVKAWEEAGEIALDRDAEKEIKRALPHARMTPEQRRARRAELAAEMALIDEADADLDTLAVRTPPRQLASDGGPQQVPTIGSPGAATPAQGEGTQQQKAMAESDPRLAPDAKQPAAPKPAAKG